MKAGEMATNPPEKPQDLADLAEQEATGYIKSRPHNGVLVSGDVAQPCSSGLSSLEQSPTSLPERLPARRRSPQQERLHQHKLHHQDHNPRPAFSFAPSCPCSSGLRSTGDGYYGTSRIRWLTRVLPGALVVAVALFAVVGISTRGRIGTMPLESIRSGAASEGRNENLLVEREDARGSSAEETLGKSTVKEEEKYVTAFNASTNSSSGGAAVAAHVATTVVPVSTRTASASHAHNHDAVSLTLREDNQTHTDMAEGMGQLPPESEEERELDMNQRHEGGAAGRDNGHENDQEAGPAGETEPWQAEEGSSTAEIIAAGTKEGDEAIPSLVQCYSSPAANPSEGVWVKSENGPEDSPMDLVDWKWKDMDFLWYGKCRANWAREHGKEGPMPYYTWKPEQCSLDAVDESKFCRVMDGRKGLLFVGDSITRLMVSTLASVLRAEALPSGDHKGNRNLAMSHDEWSACGGNLIVAFHRNDFLDARTDAFKTAQCEPLLLPPPPTPEGVDEETEGGGRTGVEGAAVPSGASVAASRNTRCIVFADDATLSRFDTLVLNSGAHPAPMEEYRAVVGAAGSTVTASMRRLHGDRAIMIVRNTVPGHWNCTSRIHSGPVSSAEADRLVAEAPESFKWSTFGDRNAILEEAFPAAEGWKLLDAYSPTILRPDSHQGGNDCLHYCLPGPVDHWVTLLYNMLLAEQ